MTSTELQQVLQQLLELRAEYEIVEFKEAKSTFDFTKLGKYFSALSNEANLQGKPYAWLIFGVENVQHNIVGSRFRLNRKDLDNLKSEIANKTTNRITFIEIYEVAQPEGRVIMFQIPAAPKGFPIAFKGHYYGRDDEELSPLNLEEIERIRAQATTEDWSASIIPGATLEDLAPEAIQKARDIYKIKNRNKAFYKEIDTWSDTVFLDRLKVTINGKITHAALLLLGKNEASHFLLPHVAEITWKLETEERAYQHFGMPLFLSVNQVLSRIRNVNYKFFPENQLISVEVPKYDNEVILEALNNCIAHQDYARNSRIVVVEKVNKLIFENSGNFFDGKAEDYFLGQKTPKHYRNKWLAEAMVNLNMIDTMGYGIFKMLKSQKERYFPLPDYSKSTVNEVVLEIYGHSIDENYAKLLIERRSELDLADVILLDRVQKGLPITEDAARMLRKKKLIEGRKPNYFIGIKVAEKTGQKAKYTRNKGLDKAYYLDFILKAIKQHGSLSRHDVDELLWDKLPEWMEDNQRKNKIGNLLSELRMKGKVENKGTFHRPQWSLKQES